MLAKPKYYSPPDEVCCWQGRCGGAVAGREPSAQRTAGRGAAAKSHQEDVPGRGAVAELMAGLGAVAELLAESAMEKRMAALWQRAIGKMLAGRGTVGSCWKGRRGRAAGRGAVAELMAGSAMAKRIAALWQRAIWKMLLTGALWQRYCCQGEPSGRRC